MRKGTTPTHSFVLPFHTRLIKELEITYHQNGKEVLTKHTRDAKIEDNTVSVTLTQNETFNFREGVMVEIQIRILTIQNEVALSDVMRTGCGRCLFDGVMR